MPFCAKSADGRTAAEFDVAFDVIDGDLPFLLDLPSLIAMESTINHKYLSLGFNCRGKYHRMQLMKTGDHLLLPFVSKTIDLERDSDRTSAQRGGVKYYSGRSNKKEVKFYTPGHCPKEAEGSDRNVKSTYHDS